MLWAKQRQFYLEKGPDAWKQDVVPWEITSNPFVAHQISQIVSAFVRDGQKAASNVKPLYILDLGAGNGSFAFHFLKNLRAWLQNYGLQDLSFKYVLADLARKNVDHYKSHPSFQPYFEAGILDCALFDASENDSLHLELSGAQISPDNRIGDLVLLANYFLDSLPPDAFSVKDRQLHEVRVSLQISVPVGKDADYNDLRYFMPRYQHVPAGEPYPEDSTLAQVVQGYLDQLEDTHFLIPRSAITSINRLLNLSEGRTLLLALDHGYSELTDWLDQPEPHLITQGAISMLVNFHALQAYYGSHGVTVLRHPDNDHRLALCGLLFNADEGERFELEYAFHEHAEPFSPLHYIEIVKHMVQQANTLTFEEIMSVLRLSRFDLQLLRHLSPRLLELLPHTDLRQRRQMAYALEQLWKNYYPVSDFVDPAFQIGMLYYQMGHYQYAIEFFRHSLENRGHAPATLLNLAFCHYQHGELDQAREYVEATLALEPDNQPAISFGAQINT